MRLGLVLGAGGVPGYGWHTGVLRALEDDIGIDWSTVQAMVGTSAGSYAAAYLRGGLRGGDLYRAAIGEAHEGTAVTIAERIGPTGSLRPPTRPVFKPLASSVLGHAVRTRTVPRIGALLAGLLPAGTVSGDPFLTPLRTLWDGKPWPLGMRIPAVRARDGARVVFDAASGVAVADAVAASSAVPAYMEPVLIGGEQYVDGSVYAPTSADLLHGEPLDAVLVSAPMSAPAAGMGWRRDVALRVWASHHARVETEGLARAGIRVITIAPDEASLRVLADRTGTTDERRAAAARAAYEQVHGGADSLARLLR